MMFYFFPQQDAAVRWQMGFQDPATPVAEGIFDFHHELFNIIVFIVVFVGILLARCIQLFNSKQNPVPAKFVHNTMAEIIWTLTPAYLLLVIAIPSFALLYSMDECIDPQITIKAIGHQWYWSYEYSDYNTKEKDDFAFDSYMINDNDLQKGQLRLLEVDRRVVVPINTHVRVLTTSADVIHSWAVPSLGVKIDACPGRINQTSFFIKRGGTFYGQCSEICGVNHGFMPIVITAVKLSEYSAWLSNKGNVITEIPNTTNVSESLSESLTEKTNDSQNVQQNLENLPAILKPKQQNQNTFVENKALAENKSTQASETTIVRKDPPSFNRNRFFSRPEPTNPFEQFLKIKPRTAEDKKLHETMQRLSEEFKKNVEKETSKLRASKTEAPKTEAPKTEVKKDKLGDPIKPVSQWEPVPFNPKWKDKLGDPVEKPESQSTEKKND